MEQNNAQTKENPSAKLCLGVSVQDITPSVGTCLYGYAPNDFSVAVRDALTATAFFFTYGQTRSVMVSLSICLLNTNLSNKIRTLIESRFGIPYGNVILSATHTHSGANTAGESGWGAIDEKYCNGIFIPKILAAVEAAVKDSEPVLTGEAHGDSLIGINRREKVLSNDVILGQSEWGSFDPKMTILSFVTESGKPKATMIFYGAHGTAAGRAPLTITRDWIGIMTDRITEIGGGVCAFFNEAEGDVGPRLSNGQTTGDLSYVEEHGKFAAADAERIYRLITDYKPLSMSCSGATVRLPLNPRESEEFAKKQFELYKDETVNIGKLKREHYKAVADSYSSGYAEREYEEITQTLFRLGDLLFVTFPYEIFSEITMRINKYCDKYTVISLGITNGSEGYFCTDESKNGYEVDMFKVGRLQTYASPADSNIIAATLKNIENFN